MGGAVDDEKFVELFRSLVDKLIEFNVKIGDAEIYKGRIKCLGFIIDLKGETSVEPLQKNLDKIKGFKTLGTIKDIRSLLGMTNFYRSFVPKYADLALPLEERLKEKPVPKNLEKDSQLQEDAEKLKSAILKYSVLSAYDKDLPIEVYVDASGAAAGAVVVQRKSDGNCSIVRYWSKKFNDSQAKYNTTRREALSLVWAVKYFKYMFKPGKPTVFYVDHKPLETFLTSGGGSGDALLQRWSLLLQEENIEIIWMPGKENPADFPSRKILTVIQSAADIEENVRQYLSEKLSSGGENDAEIDEKYDDITRRWSRRYKLVDGILYKDGYPVLPRSERLAYIVEQHESLSHCPKTVLIEIIKDRFKWEGLEADVAAVVDSCLDCQRGRIHQGSRIPTEENLIPTRSAWQLFDEIGIDFMTDLPETDRKAKNMLVIVEAVASWLEAYATRTKSAVEVAGCLWDFFSRYCVPRRIRCDRGSEFLNEVISEMAKIFDFEVKPTSRYHPSANGQTERKNTIVWDRLEKMTGDNTDWDLDLRGVVMSVNNMPQRRLGGLSAYELVFQSQPRLPLDLRWKILKDDIPDFKISEEGMVRFINQRAAEHRALWERAKMSSCH